MSNRSVDPRTLAGDPFAFAGEQERKCACNDGWVTIGHLVLDEDTGEEVEEFALYLCRRCSEGREG